MPDPQEKRNWLGPYIPQGNVVSEVFQQIKLVYNLMLDGRVPALTKLIPVAAVAYLVLPIEPTDILPILGQLDDVALLMLGTRLFLELAPAEVVREHLRRIAETAHWTVTDNPPPAVDKPQADDDVVDGSVKTE